MTPGQAVYEKWETTFALRSALPWKDLPDESKEAWESIAKVAIDVWHHRLP